MYALVDANSFYCSAESVFRPDWRGKPLIVLSNNDACVVAVNRQAKEMGIKKFVPYFQVKSLCDKLGVIICSSNYALYSDLSSKMMNVVGRFAPEQFVYSIDESFLSFNRTNLAIGSLHSQGKLIRKAVWQEVRLPVCVGFGSTLTLAKAANHMAKKVPGCHGVCVIDNENDRIAILQSMGVGDVWGVGRKTSKRLESIGIHTAYDLAIMPASLARLQFSIDIERTVRELNGQACKEWDQCVADKKQIFSTRSVGERITDYDLLLQALSMHVSIAAAKARKQGSSCKTMLIFASTSSYDERPIGFKALVNLPCATNCSIELTQAMHSQAHKLYQEGVRYYKVGVGLIDLVSTKNRQLDLFAAPKANPALMQTLDGINQRYGRDTLFLAAQGIDETWAMRRDLLTPQYTTRWDSLPVIKC